MWRQLLFVSLLFYVTVAQHAKVNPQSKPADVKQQPVGNPQKGSDPPQTVSGPAHKGPVAPQKKWLTLKGTEPLVIAKGGYAGIFPDSSFPAYAFGPTVSVNGMVAYCDLQLTKDNLGICLPQLLMDNVTDIAQALNDSSKTYDVYGQSMKGRFSVDYTLDDLQSVRLIQNVLSRDGSMDGLYPLMSPDAMAEIPADGIKDDPPPPLWLNVQYDLFYAQRKLSAAEYILSSTPKYFFPAYISSPEINFLKGLAGKKDKNTKLIFRFLAPDAVEPTTNQKYSSILGNLSSIKTFASGILVPKEYIYPVDKNSYLLPPTTLVTDAHKLGLEVYAGVFMNDLQTQSFNYSWDPLAEYLGFIDNPQFAVDGLLTDFPSTASAATECFAVYKNSSRVLKGLVFSHNGASGVYPGCTDLAYQRAMDDGADAIDCSVQMSKDGIAFCMASADIGPTTTAAGSLISRSRKIPEIQPSSGIFSFDLTWAEIQSLKSQIENPYSVSKLYRNPANKNAGQFVTLSQFLDISKKKPGTGVLINIENAAYIAANVGFNITDTVATALKNASLDKQSAQKVFIQSDDSSVLLQFQDVPTYQRILHIKDVIGDVGGPVAKDIKKYADAVNVDKYSIVQPGGPGGNYAGAFTNVTAKMHAANISVYVSTFMNEYTSIKFDYFSDPYVELATYLGGNQNVDGVFTDYPATADAFLRSPCASAQDTPYKINAAEPGLLVSSAFQDTGVSPGPNPAPAPALTEEQVVDPPLPPVMAPKNADSTAPPPGPAPSPSHSGASATAVSTLLSVAAAVMGMLVL